MCPSKGTLRRRRRTFRRSRRHGRAPQRPESRCASHVLSSTGLPPLRRTCGDPMMAERPISAKVLRRESPPPAVPRRDFMGRKTAATETDVAAPQAAITAAHVAELHEPRRSNPICTTGSAQPPGGRGPGDAQTGGGISGQSPQLRERPFAVIHRLGDEAGPQRPFPDRT